MIKFLKGKWFYLVVMLIALIIPALVPSRYLFQTIILPFLGLKYQLSASDVSGKGKRT